MAEQTEHLARLTGPDRFARVDALEQLVADADGGDERAKQALRTVVLDRGRFDSEIYSRALNRVGAFGDLSLHDSLLAALADDDYGCQPWIASACARLGVQAAEPMLLALLDHRDDLVRESACRALGQLGCASARVALARRLEDPADFVRAAAATALADMGGDESLALLWQAFQTLRSPRLGYLATAIARFGPNVVDGLARMTVEGDPDHRYWAARALGSTGETAVGPVLERLATADHGSTSFGARVSTAAKAGLRTLQRTQERLAG
jgi:HEAT repeat protein